MEYVGVIEWLENAGIVNICYSLEQVSLQLKGNYNPDNYRLYLGDPGLLIARLDETGRLGLLLKKYDKYREIGILKIFGKLI